MSDFTPASADWLLRTLAVGAGVLLLGWLAVRVSRPPASRRRIASVAIRAALLVPCALPAWVLIPRPDPSSGRRAAGQRIAPDAGVSDRCGG